MSEFLNQSVPAWWLVLVVAAGWVGTWIGSGR